MGKAKMDDKVIRIKKGECKIKTLKGGYQKVTADNCEIWIDKTGVELMKYQFDNDEEVAIKLYEYDYSWRNYKGIVLPPASKSLMKDEQIKIESGVAKNYVNEVVSRLATLEEYIGKIIKEREKVEEKTEYIKLKLKSLNENKNKYQDSINNIKNDCINLLSKNEMKYNRETINKYLDKIEFCEEKAEKIDKEIKEYKEELKSFRTKKIKLTKEINRVNKSLDKILL